MSKTVCECGEPKVNGKCPVCDIALAKPAVRVAKEQRGAAAPSTAIRIPTSWKRGPRQFIAPGQEAISAEARAKALRGMKRGPKLNRPPRPDMDRWPAPLVKREPPAGGGAE